MIAQIHALAKLHCQLQIPSFTIPCFTDSFFYNSVFYRFLLLQFRVLQIPAFTIPLIFTTSGRLSCFTKHIHWPSLAKIHQILIYRPIKTKNRRYFQGKNFSLTFWSFFDKNSPQSAFFPAAEIRNY